MSYIPSANFPELVSDLLHQRNWAALAALGQLMSAEVAEYLARQPRLAQQHPGATLRVAGTGAPVPDPPSLLAAILAARPELRTAATDGLAHGLAGRDRPVSPAADLRGASAPLTTVEPPDLTAAILAARAQEPVR